MLSYRIENDGTVQCHINCKAYTFGREHKCYDKLIAAIRAYDEGDLSAAAEIPKLINITWAVEDYVSESEELKVVRGQLFFQGVLIQHFSFVDRLLKQMEMDLPVDRLVKFIERLLKNPNAYHIADALFEFMSKGDEACHLPIYPDGRLMTFKRVKPDGTPFHIDANFTQRYIPLEEKYADDIVRMRAQGMDEEGITEWLQTQKGHIVHKPRFVCDTESSKACSEGLHSGRFDYLKHFHWGADGINMACAIDPQDILAAHCSGDWKIRSTKVECRQLVDDAVVDLAVPDSAPTPVAMPHHHAFDDDFDYEDNCYDDDCLGYDCHRFDCCDEADDDDNCIDNDDDDDEPALTLVDQMEERIEELKALRDRLQDQMEASNKLANSWDDDAKLDELTKVQRELNALVAAWSSQMNR